MGSRCKGTAACAVADINYTPEDASQPHLDESRLTCFRLGRYDPELHHILLAPWGVYAAGSLSGGPGRPTRME